MEDRSVTVIIFLSLLIRADEYIYVLLLLNLFFITKNLGPFFDYYLLHIQFDLGEDLCALFRLGLLVSFLYFLEPHPGKLIYQLFHTLSHLKPYHTSSPTTPKTLPHLKPYQRKLYLLSLITMMDSTLVGPSEFLWAVTACKGGYARFWESREHLAAAAVFTRPGPLAQVKSWWDFFRPLARFKDS